MLFRVAHAGPHLANPRKIQIQHCQNGPALNADGLGIQCIRFFQTQKVLSDDEMTGGTDREVFSQAFNESEDN